MNILKNKRILVVEDEPFIALDMCLAVRAHGGEVAGMANSFEKAMDMANTLNIDVALLDLNLGDRNSSPVAELLRHRQIPFVVYTGCGDTGDMKLKWPDVPILEKPLPSETVMQSLASAA